MKSSRMRRIKKRILAGGLAVIMVFSCMDGMGNMTAPAGGRKVQAAESSEFISGDSLWRYRKLTDEKIVLTAYMGSADQIKNLVIPEKIDGMQVTALDSYHGQKENADSSWSYWKQAAYMETVTIPKGVTRIERGVFRGCTSLKKVNLSSTVKRLGSYAFADCSALVNITLNKVQIIGEGAFANCTSLSDIDLSGEVTKVGDYAFKGCTNLETMKDSSKVVSYGVGAFQKCGLTEAEIYGGDMIADRMFQECSKLETVKVHSDLTSIGKSAFYKCEALMYISCDRNICNIGDYAFYYCTSLKEQSGILQWKETVSVGNYAFYYCTSLQSYPDGTMAYLESDNEDTVNINEWWRYKLGMIEYPDWAGGCIPSDESYMGSRLNKVQLPCIKLRSTRIGDSAFAGSGIQSMYITTGGEGNLDIGKNAFYMSKLKNIELDGTVSAEDQAFAECNDLVRLGGSYGEEDYSYTIFENSAYKILDGTPWIKQHIQSGMVTDRDNGTILQTEKNYDFGDLTISENITEIANGAFQNNKKITSVVIPRSVKRIGAEAFKGCTALKTITIEGDDVDIEQGAFEDTPWLEGQTDEQFIIVNKTLLVKCMPATEVVIPKEVTRISSGAFLECGSLESISFEEGSRLSYIGKEAFAACYSLNKIVFPEGNDITVEAQGMFASCESLKELVIPEKMVPAKRHVLLADDPQSPLCGIISQYMTKVTIHSSEFLKGAEYDMKASSYTMSITENMTIELGEEITKLPDYSLYFFRGKLLYSSNLAKVGDYVFGRDADGCSNWKNTEQGENGWLWIGDKFMGAWDGEIYDDRLDDNGLKRGLSLKGVSEIAGNALQNWEEDRIQLDEQVTFIADNAFAYRTIIIAEEDSYAAAWAQENGYDCLSPEEVGEEFDPLIWGPDGRIGPSESPSPSAAESQEPAESPSYSPMASQEPAESPSYSPMASQEPNGSQTPFPAHSGDVITTAPATLTPDVSVKPAVSPQTSDQPKPTGKPSPELTPSPDDSMAPLPVPTPSADQTKEPDGITTGKPETPLPDYISSPTPTGSLEATGAPVQSPDMQPSASGTPLPLISSGPSETKKPSGTKAPSRENIDTEGIQALRVTNVMITQNGICRSGLKLNWNGGKNVKYRIYRSVKKKADYKQLKETEKQTYVDLFVQKGVRYYYKVQLIRGNKKVFSAPVSMTVNKKIIKPVIKLKGTQTTYVISLKKSEGTRYQFQLRMKGYNGGSWFTTERYQGKLKKKIVMKKNPGSSSDFDMRLRTQVKIKGKWKNSSWSKTIRYRE